MLILKNPGLIDVSAMITHGISAKDTDNPIGIFGTGLKYAIAIILRNGGSVTIYRGAKAYVFATRKKLVRGKEFKLVTMNGKDLGFTDRLGLNWEIWQAYRELWSNCRDEKGHVYAVDSTTSDRQSALSNAIQKGHTVIAVESPELEHVHHDRHNIILSSEATTTLPGVEVHPGESEYVFYKGIRVTKLQTKSLYTYNLVGYELLTEDRTLMYPTLLPSKLTRAIMQGTSTPFLHAVLNKKSSSHYLEEKLPFDNARDTTPSTQFMEVADQLYAAKELSPGASLLFKKYQDTMPGYKSPYIVTLNEMENTVFEQARALVLSKIPAPGFAGVRVEFKSSMESRRVVVGAALITLDHGLIAKGHIELAKALLEGLAMTKGGSYTEQFTHFILFGKWVPEELTQTPAQRDYDPNDLPF